MIHSGKDTKYYQGSWSYWRFSKENITPERKIEHGLLMVGGPESTWSKVGYGFGLIMFLWLVIENLGC